MIDPTQTTGIRQAFEADAKARFKKVRRKIPGRIADIGLVANRFEFLRDEARALSFMDWLVEELDRDVLELVKGVPIKSAASEAWTSTYVRRSYKKGVTNAATHMRKAGATVRPAWLDAAFNRPIHADRLGLIFTRTFQDLQGITEVMSDQIARVLAEGIGEGIGPLDMARNITERVDKVGISRARVLARTEVINAHAEASLNSYTEAGVEGVEAKAEFTTAGDSRVCPECERLEGRVYTIEEARGVIPVHPLCRCAWIPSLNDLREVTLP